MTFHQVLASCIILASGISISSAQAGLPVSAAKAAELALHRVQKLVDLHELDSTFLLNIETVQIARTAHYPERGFEIKVSQPQATDGTSRVAVIILQEDGKFLRAEQFGKLDPKQARTWSGKDSVELSELALHHLLHQAEHHARLKPYVDSLVRIRLSQRLTNAAGEIAIVEFTAAGIDKKLEYSLDRGGKVFSEDTVPGHAH